MDSLDLSQEILHCHILNVIAIVLGFTSCYGGELKSLKLGQNTF